MTFEEQVEGLTSLSITESSQPTQNELTQFLRDGVMEVKNRHLISKPKDVHLFSKESGESSTNGLNLKGAQIINVVREAGVDNDWRECRFIAPSLQSKVTDPNSFHYASIYNPAYTILGDNSIHVFPSPSASTGTFKVYHVSPDEDVVDYSFEAISNFPANKVYLVMLYAAIQSLSHKMTSMSAGLASISGGQAGTNSSGGWSYIEYLIQNAEDIELANAGVSALTAESQQELLSYQWYGERMKSLKIQYDDAFKLEQSKPEPQPQQERRRR